MKTLIMILWTVLLLFGSAIAADNGIRGPIRPGSLDTPSPQAENRVHHAGNLWMNITNYGYFGNNGTWDTGTLWDHCSPFLWAEQGEYPAGSGQQYMYRGALWIGALIVDEGFETKRVSVGYDGWTDLKELYPGEGAENGIVERSNIPGKMNCLGESVYDPAAVANEEFVASFSDTLTDRYWVENDVDGIPHRPLGVKVTQTTRQWSSTSFGDFLVFDYRFENIGTNFLKNLFIGLYIDGDVGLAGESEHHTDDITGFRAVDPTNGDTINMPWIADNDGRAPGMINGPLSYPHVAGIYMLVPPGVGRQFSYNWWISNGDVGKDYGPSWSSYAERDSLGMGWTNLYGTPVGDERKYQIMSNGEMDFDQIMSLNIAAVPPQEYRDYFTGQTRLESWYGNDTFPDANLANGFDTRYLLSWGPLGVFDFTDPTGRPVYRLNPGESFTMSFAFVMGPYFHDPDHPQPTDVTIDSSLFNWSGLMQNTHRVQTLFESNYTFQPPVPPADFRPLISFSGGVNLGWSTPGVGTAAGYNLFGINPGGVRTQLNTAPITNLFYDISGLPNGEDWRFQIETIDNLGYLSALEDTLVRIGAAFPVTGLTAQTTGSTVTLNWNPNTDPTLTGYRIFRRSRLGDSVTFVTTQNSLTDLAALGGQFYTYWVAAENSRNLQSLLNDSVTVLTWNPQHRILVISETDLARTVDLVSGGVSEDSVRAFYDRLLTQLDEAHDLIIQTSADAADYIFENLAQYELVIWESEDRRNTDYDLMIEREHILREYVENGGRLLRVARRYGTGALNLGSGTTSAAMLSSFAQPSALNWVYSSTWNITNPGMQFIGATSAHDGFPGFMLDTTKLHSLNWRNHQLSFMPEVDIFSPLAPTEVLYRTVNADSDTTAWWDDQPCAIAGSGIVVLAFPLYFLNETDAFNVMQASLNYLRNFVSNVPPPTGQGLLPTTERLYQNYPNPFNPTTTIQYDITNPGLVDVNIFNTLGQKVATLVSEVHAPGAYRVEWNGKDYNQNNVASGIYIYQIKTAKTVEARKMLLVR